MSFLGKHTRLILSVAGGILAVIGIGGLPDDISTWWSWLGDVRRAVGDNAVDIAILAIGLAILIGANGLGALNRVLSAIRTDGPPGYEAPSLVVGDVVWNHTYVGAPDDRAITTVEVQLGISTTSSPTTVPMFYLEIGHERRYAVVEVRRSDDGSPYYLPPSGGFSNAGNHDFVTVPLKLEANDAASGWIGFLPWGDDQPTFGEARAAGVRLVAVVGNGEEIATEVSAPPPDN